MRIKTSTIGLKKIITFFVLVFGFIYTLFAYGATGDVIIATQTSSSTGSNGSVISVSTGGITTTYINENNDSEIVGNYLSGYYYDTAYGFFKLNWSSTGSDNVIFVSSTPKCDTGYGYKLGGYAYSEYAGLIDFDYSDEIFVYYCESDSTLHGFAYSENNGFQNFDGIGFDAITTTTNIPDIFRNSGDPFFVNNNTILLENKNDIFTTVVKGEQKTVDTGMETVFYILKSK